MTMTTLAQAHALLREAGVDAEISGDGRIGLDRVHTDTRTLRPGDLFVALAGERFDAHDFLPQAHAAGAVAALAARGLSESGLAGLRVPDPLAALQALAAGWRRRFHGPLVAVAGSNGKTTVTQMIAAILRAAHGEGAHATAGNLNNHIGVPLTVLGLRIDGPTAHRAAVVELGMNRPGEIAALARIAQPTVALVNNAQREHQEFMATVEAVARENGAALAALPTGGTAVFPAFDDYAGLWAGMAEGRRLLRFALDDEGTDASTSTAEVAARPHWTGTHWDLSLRSPWGAASLRLSMAGRHNALNAVAAAACALAAGMPIDAVAQGIESFQPVRGRSQQHLIRHGGRHALVIDDSYNANPDSVRAAIDVLASLEGPRWLLLGDMGEVGDQGPAFHAEVGAYAAARGLDAFWCAGPLCTHAAGAFGPGARHFDEVPALLAALSSASAAAPFEFGAALVKGSRFMAMERVVAALLAASSDTGSSNAGDAHAA